MNTLTKTISNSVMGICEISLWVSNITPPPLEVLSFLYTLYGQASGNNSEVDIQLSVLFLELLQSEVNEYQGKPITHCFTPYTIDVYARKFQSTDKLVLVCPS